MKEHADGRDRDRRTERDKKRIRKEKTRRQGS